MDTVVQRLMRYAKVYSESDPDSTRPNPSAEREFDMAHLLVEELHGLGLSNAFVDEHCYVYATLEATPRSGASACHRPHRPHGHRPGHDRQGRKAPDHPL